MDYASSILSLLPGGRRALGINQLISKLENYLPAEQVERVQQAYEFGAAAHKGQKRLSGEPYISHPIAAANILADLHVDAETIIAAILHDVIEDTPAEMDQLVEKFGREVAELVDGVTKLDQIKFKSREEAQAESFRKMLLAMVRDIRVILVKLADRTHNMRSAGCVINDYADRDLDPYVVRTQDRPLAARRVSPTEALLLFLVLCLLAVGLLFTLNPLAQLYAVVGGVLTMSYPFMT